MSSAAPLPTESRTTRPGPGEPVVTSWPPVVHLQAAGVSVVLDCPRHQLPRIVHWGVDLGPMTNADLASLVKAQRPQTTSSAQDSVTEIGLLPEFSAGWTGTPGLSGHRNGRNFSARFLPSRIKVRTGIDLPTGARQAPDAADGGLSGGSIHVSAEDISAGLSLTIDVELTSRGLLRQRARLTNTAAETYTLDSLLVAFPVPPQAQEILDFTGRHTLERIPQRHRFTLGTHLREARHGRPGFDGSILHVVGETGFTEQGGEVWAAHIAWSGNHRHLAERQPTGQAILAGGELLLPGEVRLVEGEIYETPWLYGSYGIGLGSASQRFHQHLRDRDRHPHTPRPVIVNTWEALYFDHSADRLENLVDRAAELGVERFVLDDGWFRGRRSSRTSLGDWFVDEDVFPSGLHPLRDRLRQAGMEFGLWVEPEMINEDSELARRHPDWLMRADANRLPPQWRFQQVLNLGNPEAYTFIHSRLRSLVREYDIDYLKWDHNRDLIEAGDPAAGTAGVHRQTLALYRLLAELRAEFPGLEIESCSSGGGRIDLGIAEHTDRFWASDGIDPLDRQHIQRSTSLLIPLELLGAHVGSSPAHTTQRESTLNFRAGTALFGHFGIEWDITGLSDAEAAELAEWITTYKKFRGLLHSGRYFRGDTPDPAFWLHGVIAEDLSEALIACVAVGSTVCAPPGPIRIPGLDPDRRYRLTPVPIASRVAKYSAHPPVSWWSEGITLTGRVLAAVGIQAPALNPQSLVLVHVVAE